MIRSAPIAIVGPRGATGRELVHLCLARGIPTAALALFGSQRGTFIPSDPTTAPLAIEPFEPDRLTKGQRAFFCVDESLARQTVPSALARGAKVIDLSSAFRQDQNVPLLLAEWATADELQAPLIANPNCGATLLSLALLPWHRAYGVREIVVATYQAASGAGIKGLEELEASARADLSGAPFTPDVFPAPLAFNLFPHESTYDPATGLCGEEDKLIRETRRLLGADALRVFPTAVRVPTRRAHALAAVVELIADPPLAALRQALSNAPGIALCPESHPPTPRSASGQDPVFVGRLRRHAPHRVGLFIVGDQLRKGAALNALQLAERAAHHLAP